MAEILIVEDYPMMASLLARSLRKQGHTVERALTVEDAMKHAHRTFDHAVLDIDLPDGNGVALAKQLLNWRCVDSVVFFTATREPETLLRASELGTVIDKSSRVEALVQAIDRLDHTKQLARQEAPNCIASDAQANADFVNPPPRQLALFASF